MQQPILVVGGGPAGALAAILLARAGMDVVLVEQSRFPRDKVCGECLSAMGIATLERSGVAGVLWRLGPAVLTHTTLVSADGSVARHELTKPMWGLTRRVMDTAMIEAARSAGVRVLQPARVEKLVPPGGAGGVGVATVRLEGNEMQEVKFGLALLADGKSALMGEKPEATGDLGIKLHFRNVMADPASIHLFTLPGFYGGLAAVEGGMWNVAISVPKGVVKRAGGDLQGIWEDCLRGNDFLRQAFERAEATCDFLASPLARFAVRRDWPVGIVPIGNAAAALEPIGGEGMGLALRSAELAAEAIIAAGREGAEVDVVALRRAYDRLWRLRRTACRGVAVAMSRPAVANAMVPMSGVSEELTRVVLGWMGKGSVG